MAARKLIELVQELNIQINRVVSKIRYLFERSNRMGDHIKIYIRAYVKKNTVRQSAY